MEGNKYFIRYKIWGQTCKNPDFVEYPNEEFWDIIELNKDYILEEVKGYLQKKKIEFIENNKIYEWCCATVINLSRL